MRASRTSIQPVGVFHVVTHASFKGLLFLGAGSVIHAMGGEQDMRKMGRLAKYMENGTQYYKKPGND